MRNPLKNPVVRKDKQQQDESGPATVRGFVVPSHEVITPADRVRAADERVQALEQKSRAEEAVGIRSEPVSAHSVEEPPALLTEYYLRVYVGDEAGYYLNKWRPLLKSGRGFVGFNWMGCLFNGLWFLYRKMYWTGAIVTVLLGVISTAGFLAVVPLWILCGFLANRFYYWKAKRIITKFRVDHPTDSARVAVLATKGGTNGTLIVVLVVIQVALMVLNLFLTGGELP